MGVNYKRCFACWGSSNLKECNHCRQALYCSELCAKNNRDLHNIVCSHSKDDASSSTVNEISIQLNKKIDWIITNPTTEYYWRKVGNMYRVIDIGDNKNPQEIPEVLYANSKIIQCILCHEETGIYTNYNVINKDKVNDILRPYVGTKSCTHPRANISKTYLLMFARGKDNFIHAPLCCHCYDNCYSPSKPIDHTKMMCTTHLTSHRDCISIEKIKLYPFFIEFLLCCKSNEIYLSHDIRKLLWESFIHDNCTKCILQSNIDYEEALQLRFYKKSILDTIRNYASTYATNSE